MSSFLFSDGILRYAQSLHNNTLCINAVHALTNTEFMTTIVDSLPLGTGQELTVTELFEIIKTGSSRPDTDQFKITFPTDCDEDTPNITIRIDLKIKAFISMAALVGNIVLTKIDTSAAVILQNKVNRLESLVEAMQNSMRGFSNLPDSCLTASGAYDGNHTVKGCRLNTSGLQHAGSWCGIGSNSLDQWIQADLLTQRKIYAVTTQGRDQCPQWVTLYEIGISNDGNNFEIVGQFRGNSDTCTPVTHELGRGPNEPLVARYIRLYPKEFNGHVSMRWNVTYI